MAKMPVDRARQWEDVFRTVDPGPGKKANKANEAGPWEQLHQAAVKSVLPSIPPCGKGKQADKSKK